MAKNSKVAECPAQAALQACSVFFEDAYRGLLANGSAKGAMNANTMAATCNLALSAPCPLQAEVERLKAELAATTKYHQTIESEALKGMTIKADRLERELAAALKALEKIRSLRRLHLIGRDAHEAVTIATAALAGKPEGGQD